MTYTDENKMIINNQLNEGGSIKAIYNVYGVSRSTLYRQTHDDRESASAPENVQVHSARDWNILRRRMEKLEKIIAILKTVNCTIHAPLKEKLTELELLYSQYDVHTLCEVLEVSRGTLYNHILRKKRGDACFEKRREEYRILICYVFNEYRQVLGTEKIRTILLQRGHKVSTKFVADVVREMGLTCVHSTAKQEYLKLQKSKKNILQQQFSASKPNEIWVSDVTCFKLNNRHYYVCVILDLFSPKVISHKIAKKNSTQLITSTFKNAWELRSPNTGLLFYSDVVPNIPLIDSNRYFMNMQQCNHFLTPESRITTQWLNPFLHHSKRKNFIGEITHMNWNSREGLTFYIESYNTRRPYHTLKNLRRAKWMRTIKSSCFNPMFS